MENNITRKRLGLVSAVAVLMLLPGISSSVVVTGTLGSNITLNFTFNKSSFNERDNIGLYNGNQKFAQCWSHCPSNISIVVPNVVLYHMTNLSHQDSGVYHASLYTGKVPTPESNRVHLLVRDDDTTTTASPRLSPSSTVDSREASLSSPLFMGTVLCPLLLLVAALTAICWCVLRNKEPEGHAQDTPVPTVQERVANAAVTCHWERPPSSVVYSVLDFPQRAPSTVLDMNSDTQYATISYLPEKNHTDTA